MEANEQRKKVRSGAAITRKMRWEWLLHSERSREGERKKEKERHYDPHDACRPRRGPVMPEGQLN